MRGRDGKWCSVSPPRLRPRKPVENAFIESFDGRLRDEFLNGELFVRLLDARQKLEVWRRDYNQDRPHGSLGDLTQVEFAKGFELDHCSKSHIRFFPKPWDDDARLKTATGWSGERAFARLEANLVAMAMGQF